MYLFEAAIAFAWNRVEKDNLQASHTRKLLNRAVRKQISLGMKDIEAIAAAAIKQITDAQSTS